MTEVDYGAVWRRLTRPERTRLKAVARRGARASDKSDALLVTWLANRLLRRGPWPSFGLAAAVVAVVLVMLVVTRQLTPEQVYGNPILAIIVLVPFAAWPSQRRALQTSLRANVGVITGKVPAEVPSAAEVEELLARPKVQRLLKGRA